MDYIVFPSTSNVDSALIVLVINVGYMSVVKYHASVIIACCCLILVMV
jgi:hypothetical protein